MDSNFQRTWRAFIEAIENNLREEFPVVVELWLDVVPVDDQGVDLQALHG